jgi:hypothetical protein
MVGGYLAFSRKVRSSSDWKATVTPLASIMGSGFLVSAPLLAGAVGNLAVVFMAGLLLLAYLVGSAIRFNILHFEPVENQTGPAQSVAHLSRMVLVGAYFISVSYYLQLMAAFVLHMAGIDDAKTASWITTGALMTICGIGFWRGLAQLESVEKYAVSLNLGMIAALLFALAVYNLQLAVGGHWRLPELSSDIDLYDIRVVLGLLIVVQGFETSRYLGSGHSAQQRVKTMRRAQIISSCIYLPFLAMATVLFHDGLESSVTEIINMTRPVAAVLPLLLAATAIASQFSAAVADVEGASGLVVDLSQEKVPTRYSYVLILLVTIALTWETDVNQIIAYASRAFALFYALQCWIALTLVWQTKDIERRRFLIGKYSILAAACAVVFLFGLPSE